MLMQKLIPKNQRKRLFINSEIQGRILWRCVIFWGVYHFIMLHTLLAFEFMAYLLLLLNGGNAQSFSELYMNFLGKYYPIILTALAMLPVLAFDLLKMSHRIVGPLVPFQRAVKTLKLGEEVQEIKIRKGDLLTEFQTDFNDFLRWYNAERSALPDAAHEDLHHASAGVERETEEEAILTEIRSLQESTSATPQDDPTSQQLQPPFSQD